MEADTLLGFLQEFGVIGIFLKLFSAVLSLLYVLFGVIMIKQVADMRKTLRWESGIMLSIVAYIQVIVAAIVLFYALFIL